MISKLSLSFDPALPWPVVAAFGLVGLALCLLLLWHGKRGAWMRLMALALLVAGLLDPRFVSEERERLPEVVALVVDRSGSQSIGDRMKQTEAARNAVEAQLKERPNTIIRTVDVFEREADGDGTHLFDSLAGAIGDVPPERLAGIVAITDGVVHDVPPSLRALGWNAPFHALVTGREGEFDRRIEIVEAPRFGIVGKDVQATFRVATDGEASGAPVRLTITRNGERYATREVRTNAPARFSLNIDRAGINLFEASIETAPGELTPVNNIVALPVEGVREKLRVLLVSGEPHAGERTWRNLLKADPSVDLVHFTILRPPDKQDGTPTSELSLIAFPTRELFQQKIHEFDLIIFDRYSNQTFLPTVYFENMVRYVREGRPILFAAGPEIISRSGLISTPLRDIMPVQIGSNVLERTFRPAVTPLGDRHPVTRQLEGARAQTGVEEPAWPPWFRIVRSENRQGNVLMNGPDNLPLLVLKREQKGRTAMFLSDQVWLWARGYEGGGPYLDLLRRLVHWLMKEPDLEEESLRMSVRSRVLTIERRTIGAPPGDVTLTIPGGEEMKLSLTEAEPGLWRTNFTVRRAGLYKAQEAALVAFANAGPANPKEFTDVVSTTQRLAAVADESGGSARRLLRNGELSIPRITDIRSGTRYAGSDYIGLRPTEATVLRGVSVTSLATGGLGLVFLLLPTLLMWLREGKSRSRASAAKAQA